MAGAVMAPAAIIHGYGIRQPDQTFPLDLVSGASHCRQRQCRSSSPGSR